MNQEETIKKEFNEESFEEGYATARRIYEPVVTQTLNVNVTKDSFSISFESKGYKRRISLSEIRELEIYEDFVSRKLTTFSETIKNLPESKHLIRL